MKSRIRSRWYRSNEKPFVPKSTAENKSETQMGEIKVSSINNLKDDLSDSSAKKVSLEKQKNHRNHGFDRKSDSGSRKNNPGNGRQRRSRSNNSNRPKHGEKKDPVMSKIHETPDNPKNIGPRTRDRDKSQFKKRKKNLQNESKNELQKSQRKSDKNGISSFLSKLFGG